jgi:hypothetical protein
LRARNLTPLRAAAVLLERDDMRVLGIERTSRIGRARSRRRWGRRLRDRQENLGRHLATLEDERRRSGRAGISVELRDGWALDDSGTLPHLGELLEQMNLVISERGLRPWAHHGKPFLRDILPEGAWERYRSILDFACSPEVLAPISRYSGFVPPLSRTLPPGVRLMESSTRFDPQPDGPWRSSQLWHIDYHSYPTIYLVVVLREIGPDDGPLHYLGETASRRVCETLGYRRRGVAYRLADEVLHSLVDPSEVRSLTGPPGTVLFIDSSRCLHFGSRCPARPRYQMQYAYVSPVRNDFSDLLRPQVRFPVGDADPLARRLVLDPDLLEDGGH